MPHTHNFRVSLAQYWDIFYAEYNRLKPILGYSPFALLSGADVDTFIPNDGQETSIVFYERGNPRSEILVIDALLLPDEDHPTVQVIVHTRGNPFEEPVKSTIGIWRQIKKNLEKAARRKIGRARKTGISSSSVHKMVRKIAFRQVYINMNKIAPLWSARSRGAPSKDTANLIDEKLARVMKNDWDDTTVQGDKFVNLLVEKFPSCAGLEQTWLEWKDRELADFFL